MLTETQYAVSKSMQFCFFSMCVCLISAAVIPTSVWTPTYQTWGQKAERGNAFTIGVWHFLYSLM